VRPEGNHREDAESDCGVSCDQDMLYSWPKLTLRPWVFSLSRLAAAVTLVQECAEAFYAG
jgi:hypothetical protein